MPSSNMPSDTIPHCVQTLRVSPGSPGSLGKDDGPQLRSTPHPGLYAYDNPGRRRQARCYVTILQMTVLRLRESKETNISDFNQLSSD